MKSYLLRFSNKLSLIIGVFGLIIFIYALPLHNIETKTLLFSIGALLLTISSFLAKEYFFTCLEGIATINALLALCHIGTSTNITIMVILVFFTIVIMCRTRKLDFHLISGIIGLILLSFGIIFSTNLLMFLSGIALCIYSYLSIKSGFKVGWVFLILNIIFAIVAIASI